MDQIHTQVTCAYKRNLLLLHTHLSHDISAFTLHESQFAHVTCIAFHLHVTLHHCIHLHIVCRASFVRRRYGDFDQVLPISLNSLFLCVCARARVHLCVCVCVCQTRSCRGCSAGCKRTRMCWELVHTHTHTHMHSTSILNTDALTYIHRTYIWHTQIELISIAYVLDTYVVYICYIHCAEQLHESGRCCGGSSGAGDLDSGSNENQERFRILDRMKSSTFCRYTESTFARPQSVSI